MKSTKALFITKKYLTLDGLIHLKKKQQQQHKHVYSGITNKFIRPRGSIKNRIRILLDHNLTKAIPIFVTKTVPFGPAHAYIS